MKQHVFRCTLFATHIHFYLYSLIGSFTSFEVHKYYSNNYFYSRENLNYGLNKILSDTVRARSDKMMLVIFILSRCTASERRTTRACRPHAHAQIRSPRSPLATSHFTCPAFYLNICPYYYSIFHSIASHSRCHFLPEQAFNYERRPSVYLPDSLCNRSVRFLRQCFDLALASSAKNWS